MKHAVELTKNDLLQAVSNYCCLKGMAAPGTFNVNLCINPDGTCIFTYWKPDNAVQNGQADNSGGHTPSQATVGESEYRGNAPGQENGT